VAKESYLALPTLTKLLLGLHYKVD
jgi:hypothetical protein